MTPVLIDTAVVYALADEADGVHSVAQTLIARLMDERTPLLISLPTIYEAHRLILYRLGIGAGRRFLATYPQVYNTIWLNETQHVQAMTLLERFHDQDISLTDAANAVIARMLDARVATFDHHFEVVGVEVVRD